MRIASFEQLAPVIAVSGFCGLLAVAGVGSHASHVPSTELPSIPVSIADEPVRLASTTLERLPAPPPAPSSELLFAFAAGDGQWVRLSDLATADDIEHGKRKLYDEGVGETETVAMVKPANLPAKFRGWSGQTITLYGTNDGTCTAHVTGFAVVTRLSGSPGYAGLDDEKWNVSTAASSGSAVLAARIEGCKTGLYARRANLAPIVVPVELPTNAKVAAEARAALLATDAAQDMAASYGNYMADGRAAAREAQLPVGDAKEPAWYDQATFVTKIVRHPTTGVTWVIVHASGGRECGGPDLNVIGLFRLRADGTLVTVEAAKSELYWIDAVVDVDGDGTLELIGKDWLGVSELLVRPNGEVPLDQLEMHFHGCPC